MVTLAVRILSKDKTRLVLSVLGISFSLALILLLLGIFHGSIERDVKFIKAIKANVFIFAKGTAAYYQASTPISLGKLHNLTTESTVQSYTAVYTMRLGIEKDGKFYSLFVIGFDPDREEVGPWEVGSGTKNIKDDELVLPTTLARRLNLSLGDTVHLSNGTDFRIAGLSRQASSFGRHHTWITAKRAAQLYPLPGFSTFAIASAAPGAPVDRAREQAHEVLPDLDVKTKTEQLAVARDFQAESFAPVLNAMTVIAVILGSLVVGIVLYSSMHERKRELGVLLAIGFSPGQLTAVLLYQSVILVLLSFCVAGGITALVGSLMVMWAELPFLLTSQLIATAALCSLAIALVSPLPSARFIAHIDPAEAFK